MELDGDVDKSSDVAPDWKGLKRGRKVTKEGQGDLSQKGEERTVVARRIWEAF